MSWRMTVRREAVWGNGSRVCLPSMQAGQIGAEPAAGTLGSEMSETILCSTRDLRREREMCDAVAVGQGLKGREQGHWSGCTYPLWIQEISKSDSMTTTINSE